MFGKNPIEELDDLIKPIHDYNKKMEEIHKKFER